jgi:hypothetical protein
MMIALLPRIQQPLFPLFPDTLPRLLLIHKLRIPPLIPINRVKDSLSANESPNHLPKLLTPSLVVQKHDRVFKPPVKLVLDALNRYLRALQVLVPGQHDQRRVFARRVDVRFLASCEEGLVEGESWARGSQALSVPVALEEEGESETEEEGEVSSG